MPSVIEAGDGILDGQRAPSGVDQTSVTNRHVAPSCGGRSNVGAIRLCVQPALIEDRQAGVEIGLRPDRSG